MIDLSFKKYKVGLRVKTKKGFVWEKVAKSTWKDLTSGLVWLPDETGQYNHHNALKLETEQKRLPTKEDFEIAENHGIRELELMESKWYWSSSVDPEDTDSAYYFDGDGGDVVSGYRDDGSGSVRCVGR